LNRWRAALAASALALLAACGGGSVTPPSSVTPSPTDGNPIVTPPDGGNGGGAGNPVVNLPPVPVLSASIAANISQPITGQEVRLAPSVSLSTTTVSPTLTVTQVVWDFGDGSPAVSISNASSFTTPQFKSYAQTGTYVVTLSATDSAGRSGSVTRTISVQSFAATGLLNDTGIDWCSENITTPSTWVNNAVCSAVNWAGNLWGTAQDAYFGRDAQARAGTLPKVGSGAAGFDFTRLGADGQPLSIQTATYSATGNEADGTRWDCIKDNHTKLIWEVKRLDPTHLRSHTATHTWYEPDNTKNGGSAGSETGGVCTGLADPAKCNTKAYQTAVNAQPTGQALCGFRDWRMPSKDELISITHLGRSKPAIDAAQFPDVNLGNDQFVATWSASPSAGNPGDAWYVNFSYGNGYNDVKSGGLSARLVRSGQ
jgi:hypothetical protein